MSIVKDKKMLKVFLVKAGSTDLDDQGRISGSLDLPLSETGLSEADELADVFAGLDTRGIYSAPCRSAIDTARTIAAHCRKGRVKVEDSWSNLDHGLWHGKSLAELQETLPRFYRQWCEHPESVCPPGGETYADVVARCRPAVERILRKRRSGNVIVVAPEPLLEILEQLFGSQQPIHADLELVR